MSLLSARSRAEADSRTLVLEDYPEANLKWCQSQDIQFMVGLREYLTGDRVEFWAVREAQRDSRRGLNRHEGLMTAIRYTRQQRAVRQHPRGRHLRRARPNPGQAKSPDPDPLQQGQGGSDGHILEPYPLTAAPHGLSHWVYTAPAVLVPHVNFRRVRPNLSERRVG